ncbi:MAG: CHAD domain-containing protein [Acidobacteria bacterium]|nr:CHAD domain-containing protein [Acidobacteriota bacterium]
MPGYPINEVIGAGLEHWMAGVVRECERVRHDFAPEPVHNLRVALRRCRSIAEGFMAFDPHPSWKLMKDEGKRLFHALGDLRDTHMMLEWLEHLPFTHDRSFLLLKKHLSLQETRLAVRAAEALQNFDGKQWNSWISVLPARTMLIASESMAFEHLALQRWNEAYEMHRQAMRNRSYAAYHRLRIALKKFRYTLENFLPTRHQLWGEELKALQDLLGEVHDLHVLWRTGLSIRAIQGQELRHSWKRRISAEVEERLARYRQKMSGPHSLFPAWRLQLPGPDHIPETALAWIEAWASFRDPDFLRSKRVAGLALQIYDSMEAAGISSTTAVANPRWILHAAALVQDTGKIRAGKKHQVASYRLIRRLAPMVGCNSEMIRQIALTTRFHCGGLPRSNQKAFSETAEYQRGEIIRLAGILRLANALADTLAGGKIGIERSGNVLYINAPKYLSLDKSAEKIAAARHLLEITCQVPILIRQAPAEQ